MVTEWTRQVQAERQALTAQLDALGAVGGRGSGERLARQQIKALVDALGGLLAVLRAADPADRAEVYKQLGLRLTYDRVSHTVLAETQPTSSMCVEFVSEEQVTPYPHRWECGSRLIWRSSDERAAPVLDVS